MFACFVKAQRYWVHNQINHRKAANPHVSEAGARTSLVFEVYQSTNQFILYQTSAVSFTKTFMQNNLWCKHSPKRTAKAISPCHYQLQVQIAYLSFKTNLLRQPPSCPKALFVIGALDININCSFSNKHP